MGTSYRDAGRRLQPPRGARSGLSRDVLAHVPPRWEADTHPCHLESKEQQLSAGSATFEVFNAK